MLNKWRYIRFGEEQYHDETGRILGQVHRSRDYWVAVVGAMPIGRYISEEYAKEAVESACQRSHAYPDRP